MVGKVQIWNIETKKKIFEQKQTREVLSVAFSHDGQLLASGSLNKTIKLWDVTTHKLIQEFKSPKLGVNSVAFSPDDRLLASGSIDKTIRFWNIQTGKQEKVLKKVLKQDNAYTTSIAFSSDGDILATNDKDIIRLWDVKTGTQIRELAGHRARFSL